MAAEVITKDKGWIQFFKTVKEIRDARVHVGVLADTEKGGMHVPGGELTVAEIAAVLEYGTEDGHIPARPFVRSTFDKEREALTQLGVKLMDQVLDGKMKVDRALGLMGASLVSSIKNAITAGIKPPDAPSTIMRKLGKYAGKVTGSGARGLGKALGQVGAAASVKALIDTGRLLGAITWSIAMGDKDE